MSSLSNEQKQLLFDYCIGLTSQEDSTESEALISSNQDAAEFHSKLKSAFTPLESFEHEPCPDALLEHTINRLNSHSAQQQFVPLTEIEQKQDVTIKSGLWVKRLAIAAVLLIVGTVSVVASVVGISNIRQNSWQQQCAMQLQQIWHAINNYSADYNGALPSVAFTANAPWWKVGYQGKENHSNTRSIWLLAKHNYIEPANFICPGSPHKKSVQFADLQAQNYNDFPGRDYITYSFKISCGRYASRKLVCRKVLMSDLSPLFENLPDDHSKPLKISLNKALLTLNSINHKRRGQNVLCGDGRVEFIKTRHTSLSDDDIFTLRDTDIYQGSEVPSCETDFFLAP